MNAFLHLISKSWQISVSLWKPILVGALVFGTLLLIVLGTFERRSEGISSRMILGIGIDEARIDELQQRMADRDESAFDEMLIELEQVATDVEKMEEAQREEFLFAEGRKIDKMIMKLAAFFLVLAFAIVITGGTYFLILATDKQQSISILMRTTFKKVLPLTGVGLWVFLRSYFWVVILAVILLERFTLFPLSSFPVGDLLLLLLGILLAARFSFAGIILLSEQKSIRESVQESYIRTSGMWKRITTSLVLLLITLWVVVLLFGTFAQITGPLMSWVILMFKQIMIAFAAIFLVQLYENKKKSV